MAEHSLIADYHATLAAGLSAELADEVIDGLLEADAKYRRQGLSAENAARAAITGLLEADAKYRRQGLSAENAARAAITEFGQPSLVIEEFTRAAPAKSVARRLMLTDPVAGAVLGGSADRCASMAVATARSHPPRARCRPGCQRYPPRHRGAGAALPARAPRRHGSVHGTGRSECTRSHRCTGRRAELWMAARSRRMPQHCAPGLRRSLISPRPGLLLTTSAPRAWVLRRSLGCGRCRSSAG